MMQAYVLEKGVLKLTEVNEPTVGVGEVVVALKVAGLNRRDLYIEKRWGVKDEPLILGSDGAGVVVAIGEGVMNVAVGDEVIINPSLGWFTKSPAPPAGYEILGMPDHGTFAEKICLPAEQVEKKPDHLSWEEAGVLALSALTGYRALVTQGEVQSGDTLFIPGAGSGVATYLIQFAKALGARVIVSSRDATKRQKALELGADRAIDTNEDWNVALADETIDIVIDSIGAATFQRSLNVLKKGGKFVTFGATTEDVVTFNLREFFYGQYKLIGSTMGSRDELREMLQLITKHQIKPVVGHVFPFAEIADAFALIRDSRHFGKIAIRIAE